jgi:hypothetical protein
LTYYGGSASPQTVQTTWVICGDHWDVADNIIASDGDVTRIHVNYTASVHGSSIALNPTCASQESLNAATRDFSVSGNQATFFQNVAGHTLVSVFARQ